MVESRPIGFVSRFAPVLALAGLAFVVLPLVLAVLVSRGAAKRDVQREYALLRTLDAVKYYWLHAHAVPEDWDGVHLHDQPSWCGVLSYRALDRRDASKCGARPLLSNTDATKRATPQKRAQPARARDVGLCRMTSIVARPLSVQPDFRLARMFDNVRPIPPLAR